MAWRAFPGEISIISATAIYLVTVLAHREINVVDTSAAAKSTASAFYSPWHVGNLAAYRAGRRPESHGYFVLFEK